MDEIVAKLRDAVAGYDQAIDKFGMAGTAHGMHGRKLAELVRDLLREVDEAPAEDGLRVLRGDGGRWYVFDGSTPIAEAAEVSCQVCGKVSSSARVLRSHMRERHSEPAPDPLGGPMPGVNGSHLPVPDDWPVKPITDTEPARIRATCGECGRSWDDGVSTSMTPAPAGRCPFEAFH